MSNFSKLTTIAALVAGSATLVLADRISYTHTDPIGGITSTVGYSDDFPLANFDASLGTLTNINITLSYTVQMSFDVYNPTSNPIGFTNNGGSFGLGFNGPDSVRNGAEESYYTSSIVGAGQDSYFFAPTTTGSITSVVPMADFGDYETPPSGPIGFYTVGSSPMAANFPISTPLHFEDFSGSLSGTTTVTYTYTPFATPGPASFAAFGVGAFGLVLRKRRK